MPTDYASLTATILKLQEYRNAAAYGTTAHDRLADQERALRADLSLTEEHQAAQRAWRDRSEAAKGRRVTRRIHRPPTQPAPSGLSLALATVYTDDGPRCA